MAEIGQSEEDNLLDACDEFFALVHLPDGSGRLVESDRFDKLVPAPEIFRCPNPRCKNGGFRLREAIDSIISAAIQNRQAIGKTSIFATKILDCVGCIHVDGKRHHNCHIQIKIICEGELAE